MSNLNVETINTTTITNGTESISVANNVKGSAKAWINFSGDTSIIRNSFNISGFTDEGTGQYRFTFTTPMPNANYVVASSAIANDQAVRQIGVGLNSNKSTTQIAVKSVFVTPTSSGYFDYEICDFVIFGD